MMSAAYQLKLFRALRQVGLSRNPHQLHPARSIPRVHSGKYQEESARISACTENAGAEGFSMVSAVVVSAAAAPTKKVVVVGGGVGGLVTAGLLKKGGLDSVRVLEQNSNVGGRLQSVTIEGVRFDTGPSLLLFPDTYQQTFAALGVEGIELRQIKPAAYRLFFGGNERDKGDSLDLLWDVDDMAAQYERREKGAGDRYRAFLKSARASLELGMPNFIERDLSKIDARSLVDLIPQAASVNPLELLAPFDLVLRRYFKSDKLRMAFTFQTLYVGLTPYSAPGVFSLLAATELTDGVWYPKGGFGRIRDGIHEAVRSLGVVVETGVRVDGIVVEGGRVVGVRTSAGVVEADVVVCNRDLADAYPLIEGDARAVEYAREKDAALSSLSYSSGVISFLWGVDGNVCGKLLHHNVFINTAAPKKAWKPARTPAELCAYPNFYVHVPSKSDTSAAPEGLESVMVLLPVASLQGDVERDMEGMVATGRQLVIDFLAEALGQDDFGQHIVSETTIDPVEWRRRYGLKHGAAFGLSHGLDQLSIFRPSAEDPSIDGLFFAGASTRPGNGVPLVMIGARLVAERILELFG